MKITSLVSVLALFALGTAVNAHAVNEHLSGEVPVRQIAAKINANGDTVTAGTSRIMVSMRLGSPDAVLRDGSWLYSGYTLMLGDMVASDQRTLVVRFIDHAVSSLTLADKATVVALRQAPRHQARDQFLATVQRR